MAHEQPFQMPPQMRELAEKNLEQARTSYSQFLDAMAKATNMWMSAIPANAMTSGFIVAQERSARFAKQNADAGFALAGELAAAKDVKDALGIQARYAQTQMHAYTLQAQEVGRLMAEASRSVPSKF